MGSLLVQLYVSRLFSFDLANITNSNVHKCLFMIRRVRHDQESCLWEDNKFSHDPRKRIFYLYSFLSTKAGHPLHSIYLEKDSTIDEQVNSLVLDRIFIISKFIKSINGYLAYIINSFKVFKLLF